MLSTGDRAPDFTLPSHRGEDVELKKLRGRPVLLWFYPKADTPGCTLEGQGFRDAMKEFDQHGVAVLGISFDGVDSNREFAEKHALPFPLLSDGDRTVGLDYGAANTPDDGYAKRISYLLDVRGRVLKAYHKVDPSTHPRQVLDDLQHLVGDDD